MEITRNITIELSEMDVKQIIAGYLCKKGYAVEPNDVNLSVGSRLEGYGMSEHQVNYFKGAYVKCKEKR